MQTEVMLTGIGGQGIQLCAKTLAIGATDEGRQAMLSAHYGAYSAVTGLVGLEALVEAMRRLVPPYRTQHIVANEAALRAGHEAVPALTAPAWPTTGAPA